MDTTTYFSPRQIGEGNQPAEAILDAVEGLKRSAFPDNAAFMLYMENHEESHYIVDCVDAATKAVAGEVFTLPGIPMLYGGQELGQRGRRDHFACDHVRDENWDHYDQLINLKQEYPTLSSNGDLQQIDYDADSDDFFGVDERVDATDLVSGESWAAKDGLNYR